MRNLVAIGAACAAIGGAAAALADPVADDPIEARQEIMSNVGGAAQVGGEMAKGERDFDADTALLVMRTFNSSIIGFRELFPEDSHSNGETRALPEIWENMTDFLEKAESLRADSAAVIDEPPESLDDFRAAFGMVTDNCGTCHEDYRRPED